MISRNVRCASVAFWNASKTFLSATTSLHITHTQGEHERTQSPETWTHRPKRITPPCRHRALQHEARAEHLVFLSIAFHTIPYACRATDTIAQHPPHTQPTATTVSGAHAHARRHARTPAAGRTGKRCAAPPCPPHTFLRPGLRLTSAAPRAPRARPAAPAKGSAPEPDAARTRPRGPQGTHRRGGHSPPSPAWTRSHTFAGRACRSPRTWCRAKRRRAGATPAAPRTARAFLGRCAGMAGGPGVPAVPTCVHPPRLPRTLPCTSPLLCV